MTFSYRKFIRNFWENLWCCTAPYVTQVILFRFAKSHSKPHISRDLHFYVIMGRVQSYPNFHVISISKSSRAGSRIIFFTKLVKPTEFQYAGVLFSSATADNAVYCIIGYLSVQYTALYYWTMSFLEKCKLMAWVVLTMIKGS